MHIIRFFRLSPSLLLAISVAAAEVTPPVVDDPALQVELFASEPLIQQPIGMTFDKAGRLLVIESHTHFRPKDWKGPEHDQIVWLRDTDGDGKADNREVIFGETDMTMDIATHPDGALYLSTRNEVLRLRDENGDGRPDKIDRKLIWMDSEGKYPHNGLSGIAFDPKGGVYLGMGENLGAAYTLNGTDGTSLSGQGEGGDIWHFTPEGKQLRRVATGFWNAFGVCCDPWGNVFATDNDPDSSPPCRLLHIVEGGDYGYQFRYGRSGLHPFVSWNGRRIGTLPMLGGTGEAPCDVICYTPPGAAEFRGLPDAWHRSLLVASWADHRIESWQLRPADATFKGERRILCQGGAEFRPVAFAVSPDGALYVSDWVKRSYELHGTGRVWRISAKKPRKLDESPANAYPRTRSAELFERIVGGEPPTLEDALGGLSLKQPFLFSAVVQRLSHEAILVKQMLEMQLADPLQRAGLLLAVRAGAGHEGIPSDKLPEDLVFHLGKCLSDTDPRVTLLALHWVSDERIEQYKSKVSHLLDDPTTTPEVYYAALTTLVRLESDSASEADLVQHLKKDITDPAAKPARRRLALDILPDRDRNLSVAEIESLIAAGDKDERTWLVHLLGLQRDPARQPLLRKIFNDNQQTFPTRAAALVHLEIKEEDKTAVLDIARGSEPALQKAALQALQGIDLTRDQQVVLKSLAKPDLKPLAARVVGGLHYGAQRPVDFTNTNAWNAYLHNLPGDADIENGRRVFASPRLGACATCHRMDGLGSPAGPNLTHISDATEKDYILESLLQPNRNVAPQWETFVITTADGQTRTGFELTERGGTHLYADLTGKTFEIKIDDIVKRERLPTSIMPEGLVTKLTDEELRDLVAFLSQRK
ncbi:MAG: c-type cytochrome [Verrucomicrobiaceae bacterium]|nr:c-type cytochrome [Verrucomicrobiaceae bacterium]